MKVLATALLLCVLPLLAFAQGREAGARRDLRQRRKLRRLSILPAIGCLW